MSKKKQQSDTYLIRVRRETKTRLDKQPKAPYDTIINNALDALEGVKQ